MMFRLTLAMAVALMAGTASARRRVKPEGLLTKKDIPDTGEQWQSMPNGMEFQPASDLSPIAEYHLRRLTNWNKGVQTEDQNPFQKIFLDGAETYYDDYAQAWRALGFYIDCDYCGYDEDGDDDNKNGYCVLQDDGRRIEENDNEHEVQNSCQRFMLWAAYIDEDYSGGGVGEYAYYDRKKGRYDYTACEEMESKRCVKMDCHEPGTHFKLLGFFKEPNYDDWMEQLFKHQGDCVWTDDEYHLMQADRQSWPNACTLSNSYATHKNGKNYTLFYDVKPEQYGDMGIGLYIDNRCMYEYKGSVTADQVLRTAVCSGFLDGGDDAAYMCNNITSWAYDRFSSYGGGGGGDGEDQDPDEYTEGNVWSLAKDLKMWNDAFDVYKQCQPCKAYDLTNYVARSRRNSTGYRQNNYNYNDDGDEDGDGDDQFHCHDDADYDNVNQCMKFATKTTMLTASWRDVELAGSQGTITAVSLPGNSFKLYGNGMEERRRDFLTTFFAWTALFGSAALLGFSYFHYITAKDDYDRSTFNEPLVASENGVVA